MNLVHPKEMPEETRTLHDQGKRTLVSRIVRGRQKDRGKNHCQALASCSLSRNIQFQGIAGHQDLNEAIHFQAPAKLKMGHDSMGTRGRQKGCKLGCKVASMHWGTPTVRPQEEEGFAGVKFQMPNCGWTHGEAEMED